MVAGLLKPTLGGVISYVQPVFVPDVPGFPAQSIAVMITSYTQPSIKESSVVIFPSERRSAPFISTECILSVPKNIVFAFLGDLGSADE